MGDYEPVVPWPKSLPDTDLSHDGWTWGSGAGVWAESPNKVWVMQRGEISLPPGAAPWTCACLLNPRRTNTGRRDYSGTPYPYQMRRHHLVFAVDGSGSTIVERHRRSARGLIISTVKSAPVRRVRATGACAKTASSGRERSISAMANHSNPAISRRYDASTH